MMTPFPPKTPMQMRLEAERRKNPPPPHVSGKVDPADRPQLASETPLEVDATVDWLAHIAAGRIEVR